MLKFLLLPLCCLLSPAFAGLPVARCQVVNDRGEIVGSVVRLYPSRRASTLYRVTRDRFIELRYKPFTSSISVVMMEMPHYPWTFSEHLLGEASFRMTGDGAATGTVPINQVLGGARLECNEIREPLKGDTTE